MEEIQIFAADVVVLIPDDAIWVFSASNDFGENMPGIDCESDAHGDWIATIGSKEKQVFLERLQWCDEDSYWMFGGAWHMVIKCKEKTIMRSWDGMSMVEFSKNFVLPDAFQQKYFADCAGYAADW